MLRSGEEVKVDKERGDDHEEDDERWQGRKEKSGGQLEFDFQEW